MLRANIVMELKIGLRPPMPSARCRDGSRRGLCGSDTPKRKRGPTFPPAPRVAGLSASRPPQGAARAFMSAACSARAGKGSGPRVLVNARRTPPVGHLRPASRPEDPPAASRGWAARPAANRPGAGHRGGCDPEGSASHLDVLCSAFARRLRPRGFGHPELPIPKDRRVSMASPGWFSPKASRSERLAVRPDLRRSACLP